MLGIDDLKGLWRRSLLAYPDGRRDTTTDVHWLQGLRLYADLRQGENRPSFAGVRGLRDLTALQMAWLSRQEAFAGELVKVGDCFEWRRLVDYQPPSPQVDAGRLWLEDGMMKEEGRDIPYIEHWHRELIHTTPTAGLQLRDSQTGAPGVLVVVGTTFMFARGRAAALPLGTRLEALVAAAETLAAAQDLLDCEISVGTRRDGPWRIERSTLPYREGSTLGLGTMGDEASALTTQDQDAAGAPLTRTWTVLSREGRLDLLQMTAPA